ncbi:metallophosphoesterase, partial [Candidatus Bathyarchaeota archaeon]|nr:metallophosphoesterase [Candidatus Bathyarchaeota archaeon]
MTKEKSIVYEDRLYLKNRLAELRAFFNISLTKTLSSKVIEGLFTFLLAKQSSNGSWPDVDGDGRWTAVQTAVTLKALRRLGYSISSTWPIVQGGRSERGGVEKALDYFEKEEVPVHPNEIPKKGVIEDLWDACQVLLAFASYERYERYKDEVSYIESNWQRLYEECLASDKGDWSGPAFLAAILDVFVKYDSPQGNKVFEYLMEKGKKKGQDCAGFLWTESTAESCWHASLVLRTLSELPELMLPRSKKKALFEELVPALLAERGVDRQGREHPHWGKGTTAGYRPMHTARAMEGLACALPYLGEDIASNVTKAINLGNQYLVSEAHEESGFPGIKIGTFKSTTAVAEYFASLTSAVPVGTLIDATECLSKQIEINDARSSMPTGFDYLQEVEGGLRIAWLSDLHIADVKESSMPYARPVITIKRMKLLRSLFQRTKSYWSEKFASENLDLILEKLAEQKPNHILVTGDITNLALEEQFRLARDKFLSLQAEVGIKASGGRLSPDFWTILPGNHDVGKFTARKKLSSFFEEFGEIYPDSFTPQDFPFCKTLRSPAISSDFELELVGLDSTPDSPVEVVGMNARGELGEEQKDKLQELLSNHHSSRKFVVVALHH